jgi:hypothetical protein
MTPSFTDHVATAPAISPLAWGAGRRLAGAAAISAVLWLAVGWALGWWG